MGRHDERRDISRKTVGRAKVAGSDLGPRGEGVKDVKINDKSKDLTDILGKDRPRGWTGKHRDRG